MTTSSRRCSRSTVPASSAGSRNEGRTLCSRTEQVGETVFCYASDEGALLEDLRKRPELNFLHRPANLEDVFVKLTGRELRDG